MGNLIPYASYPLSIDCCCCCLLLKWGRWWWWRPPPRPVLSSYHPASSGLHFHTHACFWLGNSQQRRRWEAEQDRIDVISCGFFFFSLIFAYTRDNDDDIHSLCGIMACCVDKMREAGVAKTRLGLAYLWCTLSSTLQLFAFPGKSVYERPTDKQSKARILFVRTRNGMMCVPFTFGPG